MSGNFYGSIGEAVEEDVYKINVKHNWKDNPLNSDWDLYRDNCFYNILQW